MPTLICALLMAGPAMAHVDDDHGLEPAWTFDPWIAVPLGTLAVLYCVGMGRLARRSRRPGGMREGICLYSAGILTLGGALLWPLHELGKHLFTFHMIEHEIVMAVSAPLIVLARPIGILLWGLPGTARQVAGLLMRAPSMRRLWDGCTGATSATILHGVAIWAWHVPILFDAAVTIPALHRLQHLSFLVTAILFWWALVWRSDYGSSAWHLFLTMVHTSILGALMALAPRVLYSAQTQTAMAWGLTPLEDQQLAGMIMWVPAGTIYASAALTMLALWIRGSSGRKAQNG
ncbi:cytochrome c oxidase assembly protein [Mesorhizobium neociceri]|uniref:Cytochrome c oxidase assembly protein n=1 Tax=Mesorhizobium neociceri TaxID=1307853 RepID=A0A838BEU9_9HYPH|nr:cytochrome c oxidase assembly protein [Mesorhizobium neociceri]MBA1144753.1 cytochrome c oxidase assembly protein [Mesorhizobium neociceri]